MTSIMTEKPQQDTDQTRERDYVAHVQHLARRAGSIPSKRRYSRKAWRQDKERHE